MKVTGSEVPKIALFQVYLLRHLQWPLPFTMATGK